MPPGIGINALINQVKTPNSTMTASKFKIALVAIVIHPFEFIRITQLQGMRKKAIVFFLQMRMIIDIICVRLYNTVTKMDI